MPTHLREQMHEVISQFAKANTIAEIKDIEQLKGFKKTLPDSSIGQYRIELKEEKPKMFLLCILERSQVYKIFPQKIKLRSFHVVYFHH